MCKVLIINRAIIELVLADRSQTTSAVAQKLEITEAEWSTMEDMVKILEPFQVATTVLCSEKGVTISIVGPIIKSIINNLLRPYFLFGAAFLRKLIIFNPLSS